MTLLAIAIAFLAGLIIGARVNRAILIRQAKDVVANTRPADLYRAVAGPRKMTATEHRDLERARREN